MAEDRPQTTHASDTVEAVAPEVARRLREGGFRPGAMVAAIKLASGRGRDVARSYPTLRRSYLRWSLVLLLACLPALVDLVVETSLRVGLVVLGIQLAHSLLVLAFGARSLGLVRDDSGHLQKHFGVANALTLGRLLFVPLVVTSLVLVPDHPTLSPLAMILYVLVAGTDMLDGALARGLRQVTIFGRCYDPVVDILFNPSVTLGLSVVGAVPWWLTGILIVRYWLVLACGSILYFIRGPFPVTSTVVGKISGFTLAVVVGLAVLKLCAAPAWLSPDLMHGLFVAAGVLSGTSAAFLITRGFLILFRVWMPAEPK